MSGIAGIARGEPRGVDQQTLTRMATALRHRGPDGSGIYAGRRVGLAHTRLGTIDLAGGGQPLTNEDGRVIITYNGEVYNYIELRSELESRGHVFRTRSDTEVLVHAYEQWGEAMLQRLNGQFAFAIYDRRHESVLLARDRFGVRPLLYVEHCGDLYFASEAKAIFATGELAAAPDPGGLDEVFTFWAARAPRTPFRGVRALQPGHFAIWRNRRLRIGQYYTLRYASAEVEPRGALDTLDELMRAGVALRMRADVPVGGYLSGGLDSSITCTLAAAHSHQLRTFSVAFDDPQLDESAHQRLVAEQIGSRHAMEHIGATEIAEVFPDVVRHAETPLVQTTPASAFLLSRLTRDRGVRVVLTGEGSDEVFLGRALFKEAVVRLFCMRQPDSQVRPRLLDRLYPCLSGSAGGSEAWRRFFLQAGATSDPLFSHVPRWLLSARIKDYYSKDMQLSLLGGDPLAELRSSLPNEFAHWNPVHQAAYLEMVTLLEPYLLSIEGDRMGMAHSVEGRFPYLDHRLVEFATSLPVGSKLRGLREKDILRRWADSVVPLAARGRPKRPYRAPDVRGFFAPKNGDYVAELLSGSAIASTGFFDREAVAGLVGRFQAGQVSDFAENQALVAILSTQLWFKEFCTTEATVQDPEFAPTDVCLEESVELV